MLQTCASTKYGLDDRKLDKNPLTRLLKSIKKLYLQIKNRKLMGTLPMKIKIRYWKFASMLMLSACLAFVMVGYAAAAEKTDQDPEVTYEAGFYYTVKKGDTLWDLSQRFSDTPWQWPDLWRENQQIPNPHWIYPGERIRLFRKSDKHQYQVPEQKEVPTVTPQAEATTPVKQPKPQVDFLYSNIDRIGFIRDPAVEPMGEIFKSADNKQLISKGDQIYISYSSSGNKEGFVPGLRLTAYRTLRPNEAKAYGTQHYLLGIVEVISVKSDYAIAKVMSSARKIGIGDLVMRYEPRNPNITVVDSTPGIEGQIIIGEEHTKMMGDLFVAFIDKGADDQIVPGQIYEVYFQEYGQAGGSKILLDPVSIGSLLVLHTEKRTSTVVITGSSRMISAGQPFHTP